MTGAITIIVGFVIGLVAGHVLALARPPATRRRIERAARANRADLRAVWPPPIPPPVDNFDHIDTRDMGAP